MKFFPQKEKRLSFFLKLSQEAPLFKWSLNMHKCVHTTCLSAGEYCSVSSITEHVAETQFALPRKERRKEKPMNLTWGQ
jgi:hypothetical protein